MNGKQLDRLARVRVYLPHFVGIKRLLVTIALLSATTCGVDLSKLKDVSTTDTDHRVPTSRISGARLWWNRGKRSPAKHSAPYDNGNDDSALSERTGGSLESPRRFAIRYLESRGRRLPQMRSNSVKADHARRDATCLAEGDGSTAFRDSVQENDHLTLCNSTECRYRLLRQGWKVQTSFYAEEPSWIDIDEDYGETVRYRDRLDTIDVIDPFVVTRGKRIGGSSGRHDVDSAKRGASSVVNTSYDGTVVNGKAEIGIPMPSKKKWLNAGSKRDHRCNFNEMDTDRFGETIKRTRAEDRRAILLHILSMSDPFYAARGKRQNIVTGLSFENDCEQRQKNLVGGV